MIHLRCLLLRAASIDEPDGSPGHDSAGSSTLDHLRSMDGAPFDDPVPLGTSLPSDDVTAMDGRYAKFDPSWPQWWLCLRCADYRPAGGLWRLQFDRGVMRVYRDDDWVELTTTEAFEAIGVQFLGSSVIGWARVVFDGVAVWQGDTSQLGKQLGLYGGYIEITGFSDAPHTIRVERLAVDSRPVDVFFFGLRRAAPATSLSP